MGQKQTLEVRAAMSAWARSGHGRLDFVLCQWLGDLARRIRQSTAPARNAIHIGGLTNSRGTHGAAYFLCRAGTVEDVRQKARQLELIGGWSDS